MTAATVGGITWAEGSVPLESATTLQPAKATHEDFEILVGHPRLTVLAAGALVMILGWILNAEEVVEKLPDVAGTSPIVIAEADVENNKPGAWIVAVGRL